MRKLKAALPSAGAHVFFFGGLMAIVIGFALIYRPLGFIVGGLGAVWIAFMVAAESK